MCVGDGEVIKRWIGEEGGWGLGRGGQVIHRENGWKRENRLSLGQTDGWESAAHNQNNAIKTRVLDTESRQTRGSPRKGGKRLRTDTIVCWLMLFLYLSSCPFFVFFSFFQITFSSLDFLSWLHITLLSHRRLRYNPASSPLCFFPFSFLYHLFPPLHSL